MSERRFESLIETVLLDQMDVQFGKHGLLTAVHVADFDKLFLKQARMQKWARELTPDAVHADFEMIEH